MGWIIAAVISFFAVERSIKAQKKEAEKARSRATAAEEKRQAIEKKRQQFIELEAGEYQLITKKQMEIQALQSQTRSLAELIDRQRSPQQRIFTLPAVESADPIQRINRAIEGFVRGSYG